MRHRLLSAVMVLAAPAVLLAACGDDAEEPEEPRPTQSVATDPAPGPAEGACYPLPFDAAVAPTSDVAAVDCGAEHTSVTFAVGTVDALRNGHLLAVDSAAVQGQVATTCPQRLQKWVGGDPADLRLSMIRSVWFTPTVEQSDEGQSWFRCDAVLLAGSSELAPLDGDLKGALAGAATPDRYAMCGTAPPDAKDFQRVRCSTKHSWRAIRVVPFDGEDYPGQKQVRAAGGQCEDAAAELAEDPLSFKWGYEWPTAEQWEMGQTFGRCWAQAADAAE